MSIVGGYMAAGVFAAFFAFRALPFIRARSMRGKPTPDLSGVLPDTHGRALLYFFSNSCGMCKSMTPVIDRLAEGDPNVVKLDVIKSLDLARRLKVMGTPTTVMVREGKVEKMWVGVKSEAELRRALKEP